MLVLVAAGAMAFQRHRGVPTINVLDVLLPAASLVIVVLGVGGIVNTTTRQFGNESWVFRLQPLQAYLPTIALAALAVWLAPPPRFRRVSGAGSPPDEGTAGPGPLG